MAFCFVCFSFLSEDHAAFVMELWVAAFGVGALDFGFRGPGGKFLDETFSGGFAWLEGFEDFKGAGFVGVVDGPLGFDVYVC